MDNNTLDLKEQKNKFVQKVNKTKYARINAYKRCIDRKTFFKIICFTYNLIVIILSVLSIILNDLIEKNYMLLISGLLVIFSIFAFSVDLLVASIDYGAMAEQYKFAYIKCEMILIDMEYCDKIDKFRSLENQYIELMNNSINHKEVDYARYICENDIEDKYIKYYDLIRLYKIKSAEEVCLYIFFTFGIYLIYNTFKLIIFEFLKIRSKF